MTDRRHSRRPFTITCVRPHPDHGYWTAHVTAATVTVTVDRRYGSWQALHGPHRREVLPDVAAALQRRVRRLERRYPATVSRVTRDRTPAALFTLAA